MITKDLIKYVKECRKQGFSDLEIRNALIEKGWDEKDILEGLLSSMGPKKLPKWLSIVALALIVLAVIGITWAAIFAINDIQKTTAEVAAMTQQIHRSRATEFCGISTDGQCSTDSDCMVGGCSGQVCQSKSEEPVITTCEWRNCYRAIDYEAECKCSNNKCQWE